MLRTLTTFLFSISVTVSWGQLTEVRNSIFKQLTTEVSEDAKNYKEVSISGPIPWDTSEYVFKKYLTKFDTTDIKHVPTKRLIVSFSKMLTAKDYPMFREQASNQYSDNFDISTEIKGNKKLTDKMNVGFSQPLMTADGNIVVIKITKRYSSGGSSMATIVYVWENNKWTIWDYLERSSLSH